MSVNYSSSTPVAESRKKLCKYQTDGTNVSLEFDLDISSSRPTTTGNISIAAIETFELASAGTSPVSDITRTLPSLSSADGSIITVIKVDPGAGSVIVQGSGSPAETIISTAGSGTTYTLVNQGQSVRLLANSTLGAWVVIGNN